jgi:YaiO family outer membrane protein
MDSSLSRKWLANKQLVSTIGISYFDARDVHTDMGYTLEGSYYTRSPWVVQAGLTVNRSQPGGVLSASGYGALSHLVAGRRIVSLRVSGGQQAYQALSLPRFQVDVPFSDVRLTWKEWVGRRWGVNLAAGSYQSETFDQRGVEVGVFTEF